jgi:hypothetical protein
MLHDLGRSKEEIEGMKSRLEDELFPVLTIKEKSTFNIDVVLEEMNEIFKVS